MANKYLKQYQYTYENDSVTIFGEFSVGAAGAVTAGTVKGGGLLSVVKETAAGLYSVTLSDYFNRLFFVEAVIVDDAINQVVNYQILEDPAALQADFKADKTFRIQFLGATAAADSTLIAANPTSGAKVMLKIVCRNTTVSPYFG